MKHARVCRAVRVSTTVRCRFVTRVLWHVCSGFVVYVLGWAEVLDAKWLPRLNRIALVSNIVFATLIFVSSVVAAALTGEAFVTRCVCERLRG